MDPTTVEDRPPSRKSSRSESHTSRKTKVPDDPITKTWNSIKKFYMDLWRGNDKMYGRDMYMYMFTCDFICFVLMVVPVLMQMPENQLVPVKMQMSSGIFRVDPTFILVIIISMFSMTVDRIIHLKGSHKAKLVLQVVQLVVVQTWVFILMPIMTDGVQVSEKPLVQVWYVFRSIYFIISAWQITNGYPHNVSRRIFRKYDIISFILFYCYQWFPFLLEFRCMTNWLATDTALNFGEFLKLETMFCTLYSARCRRQLEKDFKKSPNEATNWYIKIAIATLFMVFTALLALCGFIVFAMINLIGIHPKISHATLEVYIQGYPPLLTSKLNSPEQIVTFDKAMKDALVQNLSNPRDRDFHKEIMNYYTAEDIKLLRFNDEADRSWAVSDQTLHRMIDHIDNNKTMTLCTRLTLLREGGDKQDTLRKKFCYDNTLAPASLRAAIQALQSSRFNGTQYAYPAHFWLDADLPLVIKVPLNGKPENFFKKNRNKLRNVLSLKADPAPTNADELRGKKVGWALKAMVKVRWLLKSQPYLYKQKSIHCKDERKENATVCSYSVICLVDLLFPSYVQAIAASGTIYAFYLFIIPVALRLRSIIFMGDPSSIMWLEPPFLDRLLRVYDYIDQVWQRGNEHAMEEYLVAKLLAAFRSPAIFVFQTQFPRIRNSAAIQGI